MSPCPKWCANSPADCGGDHYSEAGSIQWPDVNATAWEADGPATFTAHPVWTEMDGLAPAVALWIRRESTTPSREIEETIDFTPAEARALAARLVAAAEATESLGAPA